MSEFSSIVVIQTNEAGQPTNLVAFSEGDTIASSILSPETKDVLVRVEDSSASWDAGLDAGTYNNLVITSGRAEDMVTFSTNVQTSTSEISAIVDASVGSGLVDVCSYITAEETGWAAGLDPTVLAQLTEVSGDVKNVLSPFSGNIEASTRGLSGLLDTSVGSGLADVCSYITAEETGWAAGLDPGTLDDITEVSGDVKNVLAPFSGDIETSSRGLSGVVQTSIDTLSPVSGKINTNESNLGTVIDTLSPVSGKISTNESDLGTVIDNLSPVSGDIATNTGNISTNTTNITNNSNEITQVIRDIGATSSTSGTNFLGGATPTLSNDLLTNGNAINGVGNQLHLSADLFVLSAADNVAQNPPGGVYIGPNTYLLGGLPTQNSQLRLSGNGMTILSETENYTFGTAGRLKTIPMYDFYEDTKTTSGNLVTCINNLSPVSGDIATNTTNIGTNTTNIGTVINNLSPVSGDITDNTNQISQTIKDIGATSSTSGTNFLGGATPTLANDLIGGSNDINGINKIRSDTVQTRLDSGTLGLSGPNLTLYGENVIRIGKFSSNFVTTDFKASADNWNETHNTVYSLSDSWGGGGGGGFQGSAIASAIAIGNGSSVQISGTDNTAIDLPQNNMVLVLDTADERFKYSKIRGPMVIDGAIAADQLANDAVTTDKIADDTITSAKLGSGAALGNTAANSVTFSKLQLISAQTIVGNPEPTLGGPMQELTKAQARNILGVSAGTVAPPSPAEGDLWYDTTTGVDDLFAYDSGRGKWLSVSTRQYYFARNAAATTSHAHIGAGSLTYNAASRIGYLIPYDMTIVGYAWNQGTTAGETTDWTHRLQRYNLTTSANTTILDINPTASYTRYVDMTLNTDFDADGLLGSNLVAGGSSTSVQHQTITVFMKRRTS